MTQAMNAVIEEIRSAHRKIAALASAGWEVEDHLLSVTLVAPPKLTGAQIAAELETLIPLAREARLRVDVGLIYFELGVVQGRLRITDSRAERLEDSFQDEDLERARRARDGDEDAALQLSGGWSATTSIDLARPLSDHDASWTWRVLRRVDVLQGIISERPWWRIGDLVESPAGPVGFVILDQTDLEYVTASFAIAGYDRVTVLEKPKGIGAKRAALMSAGSPQIPSGIPVPESLLATTLHDAEQLQILFHGRAAAAAWAWLSNSTGVEGDEAEIEFFGYRRVRFVLGREGLEGKAESLEALGLYRWATVEESPDRILAVRQVVSLHPGPKLPASPMDIRRAAEPLFTALRSGAVSEALRSQREARMMAIETARKSSENAQSAAKSVVERTIASMGAVGGVALAAASKVITDVQARDLAVAIGIYLCVLVLWSVFVEGPGVTNPLSALSDDLKQVGDLLSDVQRESISGMKSVKLARRRASIARVMTPLAYLAGAAVAFLVACAQQG